MNDNTVNDLIEQAKNMAEEAKLYGADAEEAARLALQYEAEFEKETAKNATQSCSIEYTLKKLDEIQREMKDFSADMAKRIENALILIPHGEDDDEDEDEEENGSRLEYSSAVDSLKALSERTAANYGKLIDFYTAMANEMKPQTPQNAKQQFLDFVTDCVAKSGPGVMTPNFAEIWDIMNK